MLVNVPLRHRRAALVARLIAPGAVALLVALAPLGPALGAACGGTTPCGCGDDVVVDYTMTADLGPCPRILDLDTVGLTVRAGVTLDCQGHTITGPADNQKNAFGIKVGSGVAVDGGMTVRRCQATGFWWGMFVNNAQDVLVEDNHLYANGWKVPVENGSGYGLDVANSQRVTVRNNVIADNGNEGFHLSASTNVTVQGNLLSDNGLEQLYLINANGNVITGNRAEGGTQGLEMRFSSNNQFSYNVWAQSAMQVLENDDSNNVFLYDHFDGRVTVGPGSSGNRFELAEFENPSGTCLLIDTAQDTYVYKGHFPACVTDVAGTAPVTLDRSVNNLATVARSAIVRFPGCTADFDLDANVTTPERPVVVAALGSVVGSATWNPEADLDHDGDVDAGDLALFDAQLGPCAANLVIEAVVDPPAVAVPGSAIAVGDTTRNLTRFAAGTSRTQYYLSADPVKNIGDKLLGGRLVPALSQGAVSAGTVLVAIPTSTALGTYYVVACADDLGAVLESDETDNCLASTGTIRVGRPDLVVTAVSDPPAALAPAASFSVTDTVQNQSAFPAGASRVQYYLSLDPLKNAGDRLLIGSRPAPALAPGGVATGTVTLTIPASTPLATYVLLACADDAAIIVETTETNNCRASAGSVQVGRPDLIVSALSDPPPALVLGTSFPVTDTVKNQSAFPAGASRVLYYLSLDLLKNTGDRLLSGTRSVPALAAGALSTATVSLLVPTTTPAATYFVLACADDPSAVVEGIETNNCRASAAPVQVGRPDLAVSAVSDPPRTAVGGTSFSVSDTVQNSTPFPAGASRVQYYLSLDGTKNFGDKLLLGSRLVASLAANTSLGGTVSVTIPIGTAAGSYFLLACADDAGAVIESNESNNCRPSTGKVALGP